MERDKLGQPTRFQWARPVTDDGRLIYVGTLDGRHEFFLDKNPLGGITLDAAIAAYEAAK